MFISSANVGQVRIGSIAEEDSKIQVGDVLTHVDGQFVCVHHEKYFFLYNKTKIIKVLNEYYGQSIWLGKL